MKTDNIAFGLTWFLVLFILSASVANAQLREHQSKSSDFTGPIVKERTGQAGTFGNLFNMEMDHSYSMIFSSMGGRFQNINAYTNTMHFFFSDKLTGRLDLSLLHSPFGNSFMNNSNSMGTEFVISNAELNYQLGERSNISIHFQQVPAYGTNPWGSSSFYDPFRTGNTFRNY